MGSAGILRRDVLMVLRCRWSSVKPNSMMARASVEMVRSRAWLPPMTALAATTATPPSLTDDSSNLRDVAVTEREQGDSTSDPPRHRRDERIVGFELPVERIVTGARLAPLPGDRTRVEVWVRITPRNIVGWLGARLYIGRKMLGDLLRVYRSLGELAANAAQIMAPPSRQPVVNTGRMARRPSA